MYPVSSAFLNAVKANTRKYYWTGQITTKGGVVYDFDQDDIVKGSGYISSQCCGSTEIELGTVYAAEMGITIFSDVDRYTLEDAKVELFYHLKLADDSYETVPMGIFEVSETNRRIRTLEIKAYDYMIRFEKDFSAFQSVGNCYDFMVLCSEACNVELEQTREEIAELLNLDINISIYEDNDIETYRDVLHYVGQLLGGFFFINREGKLELKQYGTTPVFEISQKKRFSSSISDFLTRYTAVSSTNSVTETAEYYHLDPDDGLTMNLGANPFLQYGLEETREEICRRILNGIAVISYTSFDVETIGNPALDAGDVIRLTGGQIGENGSIGCITAKTVNIGGKEKLKGVGKNPRLARAKSRNDKNLTGILNKVDANTIQMVLFTNAKVLNVGANEQLAEQITFDLKNAATVEFQGELVVEVVPDEVQKTAPVSLAALIEAVGLTGDVEDDFQAGWSEPGEAVCHVAYVLNREEVTMRYPVETWGAGKHILSLYYPLENLAENMVHDFRVYLSMAGGSGTVAVGDAIGCIRGFGLAGADVEWDGTISIEENWDSAILIGGAIPVGSFSDVVSVQRQIPGGIAFSDEIGSFAFANDYIVNFS